MAKKILLADDSITIQKVIELTFSDEDFDVVTVGNGRLALEKLEDVRPDIVLCDIIMPEKDGYEVCQQIKSNPAFSHVPVLLLTGAFEPFDQEKATQVGSNGFLAKPFEPETLIAKVKDLMGRAGAPDEGAPPAGAEPVVATPPDAGLAVSAGPSSPADDAATATTAPQPAVAPSPPPAEPISPEAQPSAPATFIPEEPIAPLDSAVAHEEPLAPVTPEESATLAGEPPAGAAGGEDSASTVMFNAAQFAAMKQQAAPPPPPAPPARPSQALSPEDQKAHDDAKRFARLVGSEIKLYNEAKVNEGRRHKDLYERLKEDIERGRQMYADRVPPTVRDASNYFNDELIRILAGGDASALGL